MAEKTVISWTDHTWNLAWGCEKISPGCKFCYADTFAARTGNDVWGKNKQRKIFGEKHWRDPRRWNLAAEREGRRHRVFCSSMTDWALDDPMIERERERLWAMIRETPWLDWQLLTKRADRIADCLPDDWSVERYANVWLGVSVENREHGLARLEHLRAVPAYVRFLSVEPLLEDLGDFDAEGIDWMIVGGESGNHMSRSPERWMHHGWARGVRDVCVSSGVAYFFKQSSGVRTEMGTNLIHEDGSAWLWQQYPNDFVAPRQIDPPGAHHPSGIPARYRPAPL
jgi:protein gp37